MSATVPRSRDGCVVSAAPLAELVRGFVDRWGREPTAGRFCGGEERELATVSAVSWIAREAGLSKASVENVLFGRYRTTELRVADAIVTAIGRPEAFHDGTLEIVPNPHAPRRARAACCAGSTGGAPLH